MNIEDSVELELVDCGTDIVLDSKFRCRNKKLLITYPTQIPKKDLFEWFISTIGELKWWKISHETYKNENELGHTHFLLEFMNKPDIKNCEKFDYMDIHPNVKGIFSNLHFANSIIYLDKEDENAFTNIKINDFDANEALTELFDKIQSYNNWKQVINDMSIRKQVSHRMNWCKEVWLARTKPKVKSKLKFQNLMGWQKDLYSHLKNDPVDREIIWCWSDKPKQGKSVFKQFLQSKLELLCIDYQSNKIGMNDIVHLFDSEDVIVFDLPWSKSKSLEKRLKTAFEEDNEMLSNTLLDTLENLSNKGQEFTSVKYMGRKIVINAHIVVFSNCPPTFVEKTLPERLKVVEAKLEILR